MIALAALLAAQVAPVTDPAPQVTPAPQATPAPAVVPDAASPDPASTVRVTIATAEGPIVLALEKDRAPVTTANFLRYVDQKRLDGTTFYRTVKVQPRYGFIQFGTQNEPKRVLPPIKHEPTTQTGLSHVDGAISMAMATPGTAAGDFFIIIGNTPGMDASATAPGYAVFGRVVEGMDVVHRIMDLPTSPTKGQGIMRGQMLEPTVPVKTVRREPSSPSKP